MKGALARAAAAAVSLVYAPTCPACRTELAEAGGLCPTCWREVGFIMGPVCDRCGAPLVDDRDEDDTCDACLHAPPAWSRGRAAVRYDGVGRSMILALKHGDRLDTAPLLGAWMLRAARALDPPDLIAPTPLHWTRRARRRFNQAGELARAMAEAAGREDALALDLLRRIRRTGSQDGLSREARIENVAGAFSLSPRWRHAVEGRRVLLVDDVMTTGATLSACAETLRAAGARDVDALVFARVARGFDSP